MEKKNFAGRNSSIPREIIFEIFSWLPAKSVMRFKCVARFCNSFISESNFVNIHARRYLTRPGGTKFLLRERKSVFYTIEPKEDGKYFATLLQIGRVDELYNHTPVYSRLDYVNGLFCLWGPSSIQPAAIFNPTIGEVRLVPNLNKDFARRSYSLGFEAEEKKYKVLLITQHVKEGYRKQLILTLGIDESWREIKSICPHVLSKPGICISGVIYMFAYHNGRAIAAFDVKSEKFKIIALWNAYIWENDYKLIEVKGKLAIIGYEKCKREYIQLWILEQRPVEEWESHKIPFHSMLSDIQSRVTSAFTSRGEEIVFILNLKSGKLCLCYDIIRESWKQSEIEGLDPKESYIRGIYNYVERLVM